MAMTKTYDTIDGRIRAESAGGARTGYLPDALGSVTATVGDDGSVVNTYRYKPYGAQLSKTGAGADPKFLWVGQQGYRDGNPVYIRARHYYRTIANWLTSDPYQGVRTHHTSLYNYVNANPVNRVDPSGMDWEGCAEPLRSKLIQAEQKMRNLVKKLCPDPENPPSAIADCWRKCGDNDPERNAGCLCKHGTGMPGYDIKYHCDNETNCDPSVTQKPRCKGKCMCTEAGTYRTDCVTWICPSRCSQSQLRYLDEALFHEMLHCCNARHKYGPGDVDINDREGVPHRLGIWGGGLGANVLCLLDCLRPLFGLSKTEPWVIPPTSSCSARGAIE